MARRPDPASPPDRSRLVVLGLVLGLALGLRLLGLQRNELSFDEAFSALVASASPTGILAELNNDSSPPLYYLLLYLWRAVAGSGPAALRGLSVLCGVTAVFLAYRLGRRLWGADVAWLGALLLAVSPLHIYYSQQVRPYALFVLLALGSLSCLEWLKRSKSSYVGLFYSFVTALALYTHNYGLFLLIPPLLYVVRRQVSARMGLACAAAILLAYSPWTPLLWHQIQTGAASWVERIWSQTPPALALVKSFAAFSIGGDIPAYVPTGSAAMPLWPKLLAYLLFGALALRGLTLSGQDGRAGRVFAVNMMLILAVPFLVSFYLPIYMVARYDVIALPLFLLLCASGARSFSGVSYATAVTLTAGLAAWALFFYYSQPPLQGVAAQARIIRTHANASDAVLCTGFTRNPLEYYLRLQKGPIALFSYPTSSAEHRGWIDEDEIADQSLMAADARDLVKALHDRLQPPDLLWVAHSRLLAETNQFLFRSLKGRFRRIRCPDEAESFGITCWRAIPDG